MKINRKMTVEETTRQAKAGSVLTGQTLGEYREFIKGKVCLSKEYGAGVAAEKINPLLKPHQRDIVQWACRGGRRAIFAAFGLGKTMCQLEIVRLMLEHAGGIGLIVCPLGVRQEFIRDAAKLKIPMRFIQRDEETAQKAIVGELQPSIFITNYESVREGKVNPAAFTAVSLDEAGILRGGGGVKTFRETVRSCESVKYKFVATATPDPNDYIELLMYSEWLGILDRSQAKTRFFKRDSTKADKLTLHPHHEADFWHWVASWALFLQRPSDLGYSDEGYDLPPIDVRLHEVEVDDTTGGVDRAGQSVFFRDASLGVVGASAEKRETIGDRIDAAAEIIDSSPADHFLIWHDLEAERRAIEKTFEDCVAVYGSQPIEAREAALAGFANGEIKHLAGKPVMIGAGVNLQYHCHRAIFLGIGFKFYQFIQGIHRIQRFLQPSPVVIDIIYASTEKRILQNLMAKWERHKEQVNRMTEIIRQYGLSQLSALESMHRKMDCPRVEAAGEGWSIINNDSVEEMPRVADSSVGLILTSIPFSTQYEYSPSYLDFGHSESNDAFWRQMDFLTPHLLRTLMPGRIAAIHVKDRIVPGGVNGLGFQTVYPLHVDAIRHYTAHGFSYIGMKTIVTDVVRENNQTYRLGWTEQCKDGTKMGVGMPEYLLLFRKPPTSNEKSYADLPVVKEKRRYTRSRWQIDAHGFARSNGNRPLMPEDLDGVPHAAVFKLFKKYSSEQVYDFEQHVKLAEHLEKCVACGHVHVKQRGCGQCECKKQGGRLPVTFMLMQPQSWSEEVWADITRMRTLNMIQAQKGKQMHLCPMQFDIASRVIEQYSMPGETVLDPFVGIGTVSMMALKAGRKSIGIELSPSYFHDAVYYLRSEEKNVETPNLFDLAEAEQGTERWFKAEPIDVDGVQMGGKFVEISKREV